MNAAASLHSSMQNLVPRNTDHTIHTQNKRTSKNNISYTYMNKYNLSTLAKDQLIDLLIQNIKQKPKPAPRWRKQENQTPTPLLRRNKYAPIPLPRKSVKQMVQDYENTIIAPPKQFMDKPVPAPRLKKVPPVPAPRTKKITPLMDLIIQPAKPYPRRPIPAPRMKKIPPVPLPRTQITETARAFQGFTKSYQVGIKNEKDPLVQLNTTRLAVAHFMKQLSPRMKGLQFIETLTISFEQQRGNQIVSRIGYFNSKPKTIINVDDLTPFLDVNVEQIIEDIHKRISQGSAWLIKSIYGHYINVIQYEQLAGSSYIKSEILRKSKIERHSRKIGFFFYLAKTSLRVNQLKKKYRKIPTLYI